jgi:archaemetzincin
MAELSRRAVCALGLSVLLPAACNAEPRLDAKPPLAGRSGPVANERPRSRHQRESERDPFEFDRELFAEKLAPRPGDWLDRFPEIHQSFAAYVASSPPRPTAERRRIVLQPLGDFAPEERQLLERIREHAELFFALPADVYQALPLPTQGRRNRQEDRQRWVQHRTSIIIDRSLRPRLPAHAIAYLGVTMADLYPEPSWNFVFGEASLKDRVGVYSLARFSARFSGDTVRDPPKLLRRSLAVLSHETGHMFGITHCVRYECLMNGSNSLDELDRQRATLCPSCLQKLAYNIGFDIRARYRNLRDFYRREGLQDLAQFSERRLERLG